MMKNVFGKLLLFVLVDGWTLITQGLVAGYT